MSVAGYVLSVGGAQRSRSMWLASLPEVSVDELARAPAASTPTHEYFQRLIAPARTLLTSIRSAAGASDADGPIAVERLRAELRGRRPPATPRSITVTGTFFPALLLCAGWWERGPVKTPARVWNDPLQEWLFTGFESWAPSWDLSPSATDQADPRIIGQLGSGDEADSLAVIVGGDRARDVRENLLADRLAFPAEVSGTLCHRSDLTAEERAPFLRFGKAFDYCLRLEPDHPTHRIARTSDRPGVYSGYLWQCLVPEQWLPQGRMPALEETLFAWEHTNFLNDDALAYNKASLQLKVASLADLYGPLRLLQKSSPLVDFGGEPELPARAFCEWLARSTPPAASGDGPGA